MKAGNILTILRIVLSQKYYAGIALTSGFFVGILYLFQLGLITIPVLNISIKRMVPVTIYDIIFTVIVSILSGIVFSMYGFLLRTGKTQSFKGSATGVGGIFTGLVTVLCPVCQVFLLSLFGIGLTVGFLYPYFPYLRILSLYFLGLSLYFLIENIKNCRHCRIKRSG